MCSLAKFLLSRLPSIPVTVEPSIAQGHAPETGLWHDALKTKMTSGISEEKGEDHLLLLFVSNTKSYSVYIPGWPGTYLIAQASLKFTAILLLQPPEDLNYRTELPCLFK